MNVSYLALGDSYTIGEGLRLTETFPYQTVQLLRKQNIRMSAPEIIAKTGWTTDELFFAVQQNIFLPRYDFASLLIGVNNQYRGRSAENFREEFETLLRKAVAFVGGIAAHVFVFSIPDWGVTPFSADKNPAQVQDQIKAYNAVCLEISKNNNCVFIDITTSQRADVTKDGFLASDGLHPGVKEYEKWATLLAAEIFPLLSK